MSVKKPHTASAVTSNSSHGLLSKFTRDPSYVHRMQGLDDPPTGRDWDSRFTTSKIPQYDAFNDRFCKFSLRRRAPSSTHSRAQPPQHPSFGAGGGAMAWAAPGGSSGGLGGQGASGDRLGGAMQMPQAGKGGAHQSGAGQGGAGAPGGATSPNGGGDLEAALLGANASAQSIEQMFHKAKARIIKLWDELGIPEAQRLQFAQHAMALPSIDNVQLLNDEIQRLLDRRNAAVQVEKSIEVREGFLYLLQELAERYSSGTTDKDRAVRELLSLVTPFRTSSLDVVEAIVRWRETLRSANGSQQPYLWKGVSYLHKMSSDLFFLVHSRLGLLLDFEARGNPLMDPRKQVEAVAGGGKLAPIRRAKDTKDLPKERLDKAERVLIEEQQRQHNLQLLRAHGGSGEGPDVMVVDEEAHLANLARDEEEQQQLIVEEDAWLQQQQREARLLDAQTKAAVDIQRMYRGFVARKLVGAKIRQRLAVIKMQTVARQFIAKLRVGKLRQQVHAARKLQALHRGTSTRSRILNIKRHHEAATTIQRVFRGHVARRYADMLQYLRQCARKIQAVWRGHVARRFVKDVVHGHRTAAATKIQSLWRGVMVRMNPLYSPSRIQCAVRIQAWVRGILDREFCRGLIRERRAAVRLQSWWRMILAIHRSRALWRARTQRDWELNLARANAAATKIQSLWRMAAAAMLVNRIREGRISDLARLAVEQTAVAECIAAAKLSTEHTCATSIQRVFRGYLGRRRVQLLRHLNHFATQIQRIARGRLGRIRAKRQREVLAETMPAIFKMSCVTTDTPTSIVAEGIRRVAVEETVQNAAPSKSSPVKPPSVPEQPHDDDVDVLVNESAIEPTTCTALLDHSTDHITLPAGHPLESEAETAVDAQSIEYTRQTVAEDEVAEDADTNAADDSARPESEEATPIMTTAVVAVPVSDAAVAAVATVVVEPVVVHPAVPHVEAVPEVEAPVAEMAPTTVVKAESTVIATSATVATTTVEHVEAPPVAAVAPVAEAISSAIIVDDVTSAPTTVAAEEIHVVSVVEVPVVAEPAVESEEAALPSAVDSRPQAIVMSQDAEVPRESPRMTQEKSFAAQLIRAAVAAAAKRRWLKRLSVMGQRSRAVGSLSTEKNAAAVIIQRFAKRVAAKSQAAARRTAKLRDTEAGALVSERNFAASRVQRVWRAHHAVMQRIFAKNKRTLQSRLMAADQERTVAALRLQLWSRCLACRRRVRAAKETSRQSSAADAAVAVQQERLAAVFFLQRLARRNAARSWLSSERHSVNPADKYFSARVQEQRFAAVKIQSCVRAFSARIRTDALRAARHARSVLSATAVEAPKPPQSDATAEAQRHVEIAEVEPVTVAAHREEEPSIPLPSESEQRMQQLEAELHALREKVRRMEAKSANDIDGASAAPTAETQKPAKAACDVIQPAQPVAEAEIQPVVAAIAVVEAAAVVQPVEAGQAVVEVTAEAEIQPVEAAQSIPESESIQPVVAALAVVEAAAVVQPVVQPEVATAVVEVAAEAEIQPVLPAQPIQPVASAQPAGGCVTTLPSYEPTNTTEEAHVEDDHDASHSNDAPVTAVCSPVVSAVCAEPQTVEPRGPSSSTVSVEDAVALVQAFLNYRLSAGIVAYWYGKHVSQLVGQRRRSAALKIQCTARCWLARRSVAAAREARMLAIADRNHRLAIEAQKRAADEQLQYARLQIANQAAIVDAAALQRRNEALAAQAAVEKRQRAALRIQCAYRCYNARFMMQWKRQERHEKRIAKERSDFNAMAQRAAVKIQCLVRRFVATRRVKRMFAAKAAERAAIARRETLRHAAAVKIQCMYRVFNAKFEARWRREEKKLREEREAQKRKAAELRAMQALREKDQLQVLARRQAQAALTIQCAWRCYNARFELLWRVEARSKAAAEAQFRKRGHQLCRVAQRVGRGFIARKRVFQDRAFAHTLAAQELLLAEYEADAVIDDVLRS